MKSSSIGSVCFFVLQVLSAATQQQRTTPLPTVIPFCLEDYCYIRPGTTGKSWTDAQKMCRMYNSTLPIVDNRDRQRSVLAALYNFTLGGTSDVWLGANSTDYGSNNWRWLDGSPYSGKVEGDGTYAKSYALVVKKPTVLSFLQSAPYETYSCICQYNTTNTDVCTNGTGRMVFVKESRCYMKFNTPLSWFNARDHCLDSGGDLASLDELSLLGDSFFDTNGSWIGLFRSQWFWQNAVNGLSSDVKYTNWSSRQPDDVSASCMSIDYSDFPKWKDWNCSSLSQYICQVLNETSTIPMEEPSIIIGPSTTTSSPNKAPNSARNSAQYQVNVPLAIGLGVGLGGAALIALIVIVIIVVVLRRKHRNRHSIENSKSRETFDDDVGRTKPEEEEEDATEMYATGSQSRFDNASTDYATVQESKGSNQESQLSPPSTNQGLVYADLGFDNEQKYVI